MRDIRDAWLIGADTAMRSDPRFLASGLWGSLGRGDDDDWSDVDLVVVIADGSLEAVSHVLKDEQSPFGAGRLVVDMPQNGVAGGGYLSVTYIDSGLPLHVDWYLCPPHMGLPACDVRELFKSPDTPRPDISFADVLRQHPNRQTRRPAHVVAVLSMIPIAVKYLVRQHADTPAVLTMVGVDPALAADATAAIDALTTVINDLSDEARPETIAALRAVLELGRTTHTQTATD